MGLANTEHQGKVFAKSDTLTTLKQNFNMLACFQTTDKSTPRLKNSLAPLTVFYTMRTKQKRWPQSDDTLKNLPEMACKACGKILHPYGLRERKTVGQLSCGASIWKNWPFRKNVENQRSYQPLNRQVVRRSTRQRYSTTGENWNCKTSCRRRQKSRVIPYLTLDKPRFRRGPLKPPPNMPENRNFSDN